MNLCLCLHDCRSKCTDFALLVGRDDRSRGATGGRRTEYGVVVSNLPKSCSWQVIPFFRPISFIINIIGVVLFLRTEYS